jgi:glycosyltransferase involved in cell wall biosynthesis
MEHFPRARARAGDAPAVDLVELDGRGGPYQHTVALADALQRSGAKVVLHTATDAELVPTSPVEVCRCMDWLRDVRFGRRTLVAARFLAVTVPHLLRRRGVLHIQGPFKPALLAFALGAGRLRGRRVVFSPHNTFSRHGRAVESRLVALCTRLAHATIVFSSADARVVAGWGATPVVSPLLQHQPRIDPTQVEAWRDDWAAAPVVLFAGQVRPDKRLDVVIEASRLWKRARRLAIVGKDLGDAERCRRVAERVGADPAWSLGYLGLEDFAAAMVAADVVVCPYARASQSGILALAGQLGLPSVASDVGGLRELATSVVPRDVDAAGLARAIDEVLVARPARDSIDSVTSTLQAHRHAYGIPEARCATGPFAGAGRPRDAQP